MDWRSLIDQLSDIERVPQKRLRVEQQQLRDRNASYAVVVAELKSLQSKVSALKDPTLYESRSATVEDAEVARASVSGGAVQGSYTFLFSQLATASRQVGQNGAGRALSSTDDVSGLALASAGFAVAVTAGTFTVNGKQVTVAAEDTLQQVFDKISAATGNQVVASYEAATDRITLSGTGQIVLGSTTDTSNFLQVARLNNNGTATITSTGELGGVRLASDLSSANWATPLTDGGSGQGMFRINGVDIAWSATDTVADVLKRINDSGAGVLASYDAVNDRFTLANKGTGDLGMGLEDVTGNFLAATRLSSGTLQRGKDLLYTINGGAQLSSHSNTVTEASSGLAGVSVTALKEGGSTVVTVSSDQEKIRQTITEFLDQYNKAQSLIDAKTAVSTDSSGKVTAGPLSNESEVSEASARLRALAFGTVSGLQGALSRLEQLGFDTNSENNNLALDDEEALNQALSEQLGAVAELFADDTSGLAVALDTFLEKLVGDDGTLVGKQDSLTLQANAIDTQVNDLERIVQANRARMIESFIAMEKAQAQSNQQLQFLQQRFGSG